MQSYSPPQLLEFSLLSLQAYMRNFYPDRAMPLDFWSVADDELFLETLSYLPLHISEDAQQRFDELPEAFRIAYPIFWLEDDYQVNGWTALTNAGEGLLERAVGAYRRIGMASEAEALAAALASVRRAPEDEAAAEKAYKSVPNPYAEDTAKYEALLRFFRANPDLWLSA
jgi:hypothetical protein